MPLFGKPQRKESDVSREFVRSIFRAVDSIWPEIASILAPYLPGDIQKREHAPMEFALLFIMKEMQPLRVLLPEPQFSRVVVHILSTIRSVGEENYQAFVDYDNAWGEGLSKGWNPLAPVGRAFLDRLGYPVTDLPDPFLGLALQNLLSRFPGWWEETTRRYRLVP